MAGSLYILDKRTKEELVYYSTTPASYWVTWFMMFGAGFGLGWLLNG